jgi:hypothetical protein
MRIIIGEVELDTDYDTGFNEKVSVLRKNKSFSFSSSFYIESNVGTSYDKLNLLKKMKSIPDTIFATKGGRYFWVFEGCNLISLSVEKDEKYYFAYHQEPTEKWVVKIEIGYEEVFGTNKPNVVKREIALNNLFIWV